MKTLVLSLLALLGAGAAHAADPVALAEKRFRSDMSINVKQEILNLYNEEMGREGSSLKVAIEAIAKEESIPEYGQLAELSLGNLWLIGSSRMDQDYYTTYLMGVPAMFDGTAREEHYIAYIRVEISEEQVYAEDGTVKDSVTTITLKNFAKVSL